MSLFESIRGVRFDLGPENVVEARRTVRAELCDVIKKDGTLGKPGSPGPVLAEKSYFYDEGTEAVLERAQSVFESAQAAAKDANSASEFVTRLYLAEPDIGLMTELLSQSSLGPVIGRALIASELDFPVPTPAEFPAPALVEI